MDSGRVSDVEEIAGHGILAKVDGRTVGVGNSRLMERQNVNWLPCELPGTIVHVTAGWVLCRPYRDLRTCRSRIPRLPLRR